MVQNKLLLVILIKWPFVLGETEKYFSKILINGIKINLTKIMYSKHKDNGDRSTIHISYMVCIYSALVMGLETDFEQRTIKSSMLIIIEIYLFILSLIGNYLLNSAKNRILEVAHHLSFIS